MAKKPIKQKVAERFVEKYIEKYQVTPKMKKILSQFLLNIMRDGITDPERINRFMICNDFFLLLPDNKYQHTTTHMILSENYDYSVSQIKNIIYKWTPKFRAISNLADETL